MLSMISLISNVKEDWCVLFHPRKIIYTFTCDLSCQENIDGILSRSFWVFFRLGYLTLYFMEFIIYIFTTFTMAFCFCEKFSKVMHLLLIWKRTNYELLYTKKNTITDNHILVEQCLQIVDKTKSNCLLICRIKFGPYPC